MKVKFYEVSETVQGYFSTKPTTHKRVMFEYEKIVDGARYGAARVAEEKDKLAHPEEWAAFINSSGAEEAVVAKEPAPTKKKKGLFK